MHGSVRPSAGTVHFLSVVPRSCPARSDPTQAVRAADPAPRLEPLERKVRAAEVGDREGRSEGPLLDSRRGETIRPGSLHPRPFIGPPVQRLPLTQAVAGPTRKCQPAIRRIGGHPHLGLARMAANARVMCQQRALPRSADAVAPLLPSLRRRYLAANTQQMVRLCALLLLACALIVPRAAWSSHLSGHEELSSATTVHTHHGDHAHEHGDADNGESELTEDPANGAGDLTHEHGPSFALGSAVVLPDVASVSVWPRSVEPRGELDLGGGPLQSPDSLLRPPRTA